MTVFLSHSFLNEVTSHIHWRTKRQENTHQRFFLRAVDNTEKLEHTLLTAQRPISAQALFLPSVSHSSLSDIRWLLPWKRLLGWPSPSFREVCTELISVLLPKLQIHKTYSLPHLPTPLFSLPGVELENSYVYIHTHIYMCIYIYIYNSTSPKHNHKEKSYLFFQSKKIIKNRRERNSALLGTCPTNGRTWAQCE